MNILAIETSCDETALAVIEANGGLENPRFIVGFETVASQVDVHKEFGGVVPTLAKREHIKNLPLLFEKLTKTGYKISDSDLIAVTVGPGLEPALWTGIEYTKELSEKHNIPLIGVNHLHGHLYSPFIDEPMTDDVFPAVVLLVSGGHTMLALMKSATEYEKLGETADDAVGESFDKVARMLGMGYPGGPAIEKEAHDGDPKAIPFPSPMINDDTFDFSYSGLKTAVLYYLRDKYGASVSALQESGKDIVPQKERADIAASFQRAAVDVLVKKTMRAVSKHNAKSVIVGGGVAANTQLRNQMEEAVDGEAHLYIPKFSYCMDNATMIGATGYVTHLRNITYPLKADGGMDL